MPAPEFTAAQVNTISRGINRLIDAAHVRTPVAVLIGALPSIVRTALVAFDRGDMHRVQQILGELGVLREVLDRCRAQLEQIVAFGERQAQGQDKKLS